MGRLNALAALFMAPREATEEERDLILSVAHEFRAYAVDGKTVVMATRWGRVVAEAVDHQGAPLVWFDWYPQDRAERVRFWVNAATVRDLGESLRRRPEARVRFDQLMTRWSA